MENLSGKGQNFLFRPQLFGKSKHFEISLFSLMSETFSFWGKKWKFKIGNQYASNNFFLYFASQSNAHQVWVRSVNPMAKISPFEVWISWCHDNQSGAHFSGLKPHFLDKGFHCIRWRYFTNSSCISENWFPFIMRKILLCFNFHDWFRVPRWSRNWVKKPYLSRIIFSFKYEEH